MTMALRLLAICAAAVMLLGMDSNQLLRDWSTRPATHPHIPFVADAGSPAARAVFVPDHTLSVSDFGAKGDGSTDDLPAFMACLRRARSLDGKVLVTVPKGDFSLDGVLFVDRSNTVIRGMSPRESRLLFRRPLAAILNCGVDDPEPWGWRGGLLWIEEHPQSATSTASPVSFAIDGEHAQGARRIRSATTAGLNALVGSWIHVRWEGGRDFAEAIYGDPVTAPALDISGWRTLDAYPKRRLRLEWAVKCIGIDGRDILLASPLLAPIKSEWNVIAGIRTGTITNVGVERLGLVMPAHPMAVHLKEPGWNGIFARCAVDFWAKDLTLDHVDNAVILEKSSHGTIASFTASSAAMHHGISLRSMSSSNLIERFEIHGRCQHGISVQDMASRNVFSKGVMSTGSFDAHRGMPFDTVRTEIVMTGNGLGGGAFGPLQGRRMVNWNVEQAELDRKKARYNAQIFDPLYFPSGALVGVRVPASASSSSSVKGPWALPPGEKGCVVIDQGVVPHVGNLYESQRRLWNP